MKDGWLVCSGCSYKIPYDAGIGQCTCGGIFFVGYDLERVKASWAASPLRERASTMWRYHELLPVEHPEEAVTLGEGWTPMIRIPDWEEKLSLNRLWVKRDEQNPTGSFKARGFSVAVSLLKERGINKVAVPSNGNAASALAAYAARGKLEAFVFVPMDCPGIIVEESMRYGAKTYRVNGLIHDAGKIIEDGKSSEGWINAGTAKELGRLEGKKTMGLELAEQLSFEMPDVLLYPTGGGSGLIGIWKALCELKEMGLLHGDLPRFVSVQEVGCTPVVDIFHSGAKDFVPYSEDTTSSPTGVRVPNPPAGGLILSILRKTGGTAVAVDQREIRQAQNYMEHQGISASPEGAIVFASLLRLRETGDIRAGERVVLYNTAHALKYLEWPLPSSIPVISNYREYAAKIANAQQITPQE
ncbi:L-threonine synthase [Marininema mesophilum]|uniref:L-threonine synthase n=1 Tax=Marininema mesophilum TaxID=1048340 RepID=A0A1H2VDQ5_9BACL|nr:threonine synthase [Marininema mesophilum]SDW66473.1 L-threonine synthase [Marininema mesophilum]